MERQASTTYEILAKLEAAMSATSVETHLAASAWGRAGLARGSLPLGQIHSGDVQPPAATQPFLQQEPGNSPAAAGFDSLFVNRVQAAWFLAAGPGRVGDGDTAATQALSASAARRPGGTVDRPVCSPSTLRGGTQERSPPTEPGTGGSPPPQTRLPEPGGAEGFLPDVLTWSLV